MPIVRKIFWKALSFFILLIILYAVWKFITEEWVIDQILDYLITSFYHGVPTVLFLVILYKMYIERIVLWFQRRESAKILAEKCNQVNQVSGPIRSGKDASTTGAAIIVGEHIIRKEKKELVTLKDNLYIYDFERLNKWLDANGERFFVSSEMRINRVFSEMIKENNCFLYDHWIRKGITPSKHYHRWKVNKYKLVPDVAFNDGLTPGGKPFLDMLKRYVLLYMYHHFVPNFIMSNQPILEQYKIIDRKKIHTLFSKKLSQKYFQLKENTPMPFPLRGFIIETETAIFYANTDDKNGNEFKKDNGHREFYTTVGHLLRERVFLYGITQSPTRTLKALRELYPGYQHIFGMKLKSTSNTKRTFISIRVFLKKFTIIRLKVYRFYIPNRKPFKVYNNLCSGLIQRKRRKISYLNQKSVRLHNKGYIVFYKGVYEHIRDVGKRVKFSTFGLIKENKSEQMAYQSYGFKQVNKIADCFGRYDTHIMKFIREQKEQLHDYDFTKLPNWTEFSIDVMSALFLGYSQFEDVLKPTIDEMNRLKKEKEQKEQKRKQYNKRDKIPEFQVLTEEEIINLIKDFSLEEGFKEVVRTYKTNLIDALTKQFEEQEQENQLTDEILTMNVNQLQETMIQQDLEYELENIDEDHQANIIELLVNEYKKFNQ